MGYAVAAEGVPLRELAGIAGRHLDVPNDQRHPRAGRGSFRWIGFLVAVDGPASTALAQQRMDGAPNSPASSRTSKMAAAAAPVRPEPPA